MIGIARVNENRVQLRSVGCALRRLIATPLRSHRMIVEAHYRLPRVTGVLGSEQTLRRCACVPRRRFGRLFPGVATVARAIHRRAEMASPSSHEYCAPVPRILDDVVRDVTEE